MKFTPVLLCCLTILPVTVISFRLKGGDITADAEQPNAPTTYVLEDVARHRRQQLDDRAFERMTPYEGLHEVLKRNLAFHNAWVSTAEAQTAERLSTQNAEYVSRRPEVIEELANQRRRLLASSDLDEPKGCIVVVFKCMDFRLNPNELCGTAAYHCSDAGSVLDDAERSSVVGALKLAQEKGVGVVLLFTAHTDCGKETVLEHMQGRKAIGLEGIQHKHMNHGVASEFINHWLRANCPDSHRMFKTGAAVAIFAEIETESLLLRKIQTIDIH